MHYVILLMLLALVGCQNEQQRAARQQYEAIRNLRDGNVQEVAQPEVQKQHFSVQVHENEKAYAVLRNGDASATVHSGGKQTQLTLSGETHSIFISIPGSQTGTYEIGGAEGGSFLFNTSDEKEQFMLYGMKGSLTITHSSDTHMSGHFSGSKQGSGGLVELKGSFKDIPVENLSRLMKEAGF